MVISGTFPPEIIATTGIDRTPGKLSSNIAGLTFCLSNQTSY
jgi:hypothetical protein